MFRSFPFRDRPAPARLAVEPRRYHLIEAVIATSDEAVVALTEPACEARIADVSRPHGSVQADA